MALNYMKTEVHRPRLFHSLLQLFNAGTDLCHYGVKLGLGPNTYLIRPAL